MYSVMEKTFQECGSTDFLELNSTGVIQLDSENRIKNINREAERICGLEARQIVGEPGEQELGFLGRRFWNMMSPQHKRDYKTMAVRIRRTDVDMYIQLNVLQIVGGQQSNSATSVIILQDISAIKMSLKQIQTTEMLVSLGELAASVAHHVRTPLTTISGYLQLMMKRAQNNKYMVKKEILEGLLNDVSYINNVIKDLVMFAKPPIHKRSGVDINGVLNEAFMLVLKDFDMAKYRLNRQFMSGLPVITADRDMLQQAFINIIQNAIEAMPQGGVLVTRLWRNYDSNMIVIGIEDTGGGIRTEILPRILEPFYTTKNDRMGLGLPIAYRIIAEHGGFFNVSYTEHGTRVNIYLPIISKGRNDACIVEQQVLNLQ